MRLELESLFGQQTFDRNELIDYLKTTEIESGLTQEELNELAIFGFTSGMTIKTRLPMFRYVASKILDLTTGSHQELEQLIVELSRADKYYQRRLLWDTSRNGKH